MLFVKTHAVLVRGVTWVFILYKSTMPIPHLNYLIGTIICEIASASFSLNKIKSIGFGSN